MNKEQREKLKEKIVNIMRDYGFDAEPDSAIGCAEEILQEVEKVQ